ncbi:MAG TPA: hypothetical protein VFG30_41815 [Polyangiales bacterium]|nr:hypothetical protein [Polyangiales bacterium]
MTREHASAPKALPIPETRDREDDLENAPEPDPADFDRIWARAQIKSKTGRKAPAPTAKPQEEATGHKELSWVRPSTTSSGGLEKVGSIFFRTKEHSIDGNDERLIKQLVNAYASHARTHKGGDGLMGRVVGYADPRASHRPDNLQLSGLRAANVADELTPVTIKIVVV